jgi:hypothetical protein
MRQGDASRNLRNIGHAGIGDRHLPVTEGRKTHFESAQKATIMIAIWEIS